MSDSSLVKCAFAIAVSYNVGSNSPSYSAPMKVASDTFNNNSNTWRPLGMPHRLAFPLLAGLPDSGFNPNIVFPKTPNLHVVKYALTFGFDGTKPIFTKELPIPGGLLLARADGKELHVEHLQALDTFVATELKDLFDYEVKLRGKPDGQHVTPAQAKVASEKVSSTTFAAWFDTYSAKMAKTDQAWVDLANPVSDDPAKCRGCGSESTKEKPLSICFACKVASYCGKECQQQDWKDHKPLCLAINPQKTTGGRLYVSKR